MANCLSETRLDDVLDNLSELSTSTANDNVCSEFERYRFMDSLPGFTDTPTGTCESERDVESLCEPSSPEMVASEPAAPTLHFSVVTNEDEQVSGREHESLPNALRFHLKLLDFVVEQKIVQGSGQEILCYGEAREPNVEWRFMAQLRILTSIDDKSCPLRVVDYDIFEFSNRARPLVIVNREEHLKHVRIEIRYIQQLYERLPSFNKEGDLLLNFNDGLPPLRVHSALLALYSPYMAKTLSRFYSDEFSLNGKQAVVDMAECDREEFREVLYQMYSNNRPLWADFRRVTKGAVAYQVMPVLERVIKHLVDFDMPLIQKMKEAVKLGLEDAVGELAFMAEKLGHWAYLIGTGFDAKVEFGEDIYLRVICPAIVMAKKTPSYARFRQPFRLPTSPRCPPNEYEKPFTVTVAVSGQKFYVNLGILQLYNDEEFGRGNDGEYFLRTGLSLSRYLEMNELKLHAVVEAMFMYMNPSYRRIPIEYVRPVVIIAHEHNMKRLLREMEDILVDEPPTSPELLLDHFELSQRYGFKNLLGQTLLRIEANFLSVANRLIDMPEYKRRIKPEIQAQVMDHIVSGWAQSNWRLADSVPTTKNRRFVESNKGGPASNHDADLVTFNSITSACAFGETVEHERMHR